MFFKKTTFTTYGTMQLDELNHNIILIFIKSVSVLVKLTIPGQPPPEMVKLFNPFTVIDEYIRQSNLYGKNDNYNSLTLFSLYALRRLYHPILA